MQFFAEDTTLSETTMSGELSTGETSLDPQESAIVEEILLPLLLEDETEEDIPVDTDGEWQEPFSDNAQELHEEDSKEQQPFYTVKYNGQEYDLPVEELIIHAQKGMNYDKVYAERESLKNAPEFTLLEGLARESGMTREEYIKFLSDRMASPQRLDIPVNTNEVEDYKDNRNWREFFDQHPEIQVHELDERFFDRVMAGERPAQVWLELQNNELEQKLTIERQNMQNRMRALGSQRSSAPIEDVDSFLSGFLGN